MLLKEVRYEVQKKQRKHNKLLFNLEIEEDAIFISAKCRDIDEPILINLEKLLRPYLEFDDVKDVRRIVKSIYKKRLKQAS
ncbi:hypothetical protein GGQ84_001388 [Desulfitispora alkaliphila]|uniref:hypothetical protein n=1 Tax=Desulfitispora alkaliphila TaxID=622674 RepID=UPI003D2069E4